MANQRYYEDIKVGNEVPPIAKIATTRMLVQWIGASGDLNPLHYDDEFAKAHGVEAPIVHGPLKEAWLIQLMVDWIGEAGDLKKLSCQHRIMDYPRKMKTATEPIEGETWWCRGRVINKYIQDGENFVECDIWVENGKGQKTVLGTALVTLAAQK